MNAGGADADLRAQAELVAVVESGRSIDHHGAGVDFSDKSHGPRIVPRHDDFRVPGPMGADVHHGLIHVLDDFDGQGQREKFLTIVFFRRFSGIGNIFAGPGTAANFYAGGGEGFSYARQKISGDVLMHQQGFHGVAGGRTLDLGIDADAFGHAQIGVGVDVNVTHPFVMFDDGNGRVFGDDVHERLPAPGNNEVDEFVPFQQFKDDLSFGAFDE